MNEAKIRLSEKEMDLVQNADVILTKNAILGKVQQLLGKISVRQQAYLSSAKQQFPEEISQTAPKISRHREIQRERSGGLFPIKNGSRRYCKYNSSSQSTRMILAINESNPAKAKTRCSISLDSLLMRRAARWRNVG